MEPWNALGLAAAIVQFVEFGSRLISTSREIAVSASGLSKEHETLDEICSHLRFLADELDEASSEPPQHRGLHDEDALRKLSDKCRATAMELQKLLQSLYSTPGGTISSLRQALRATTWGQHKVNVVEAKLKEYRQELLIHLVAITR